MSTLKVFFPNGQYLPNYNYIPHLGELIFMDNAVVSGTPTSTQIRYNLTIDQPSNPLNGQSFVLKLSGTGFAFDSAGDAIGGAITRLQFLLADGTSLLHDITNMNLSLEAFDNQAELRGSDSFGFNKFLMVGNDTIIGADGNDPDASIDLIGEAGNDTLIAGTIGAFFEGGQGADKYQGGTGYDALSFQDAYFDGNAFQGAIANAVSGTAVDAFGNNETFSGIDAFYGTQFADKFIGGSADESFRGLGGRDYIDGGAGIDRVDYRSDASRGGVGGVTVNLATGLATDGFGKQDTLISIERVRGTENADNFTGTDTTTQLDGLGGNDTYRVASANTVVRESLDSAGGTGDVVLASVNYTLAAGSGVEFLQTNSSSGTTAINLVGNELSQTIVGNAGINSLTDGGGAGDVLKGLGGDDIYRIASAATTIVETSSQGAADVALASVSYKLNAGAYVEFLQTNSSAGTGTIDLTGNELAQTLVGNAGANRLDGAGGADTLTGRDGKDTFVFSTALNLGVDTITDFKAIDDTIELSKAVFSALSLGTLSTSAFRANTTGLAGDASDRIIYETDTGKLFYDADGTGTGASGIHFATLAGLPTITNVDFVVV